jgi:hypothetical protein
VSGSAFHGRDCHHAEQLELGRQRNLVGEHDHIVNQGAAPLRVCVEADLDEHFEPSTGLSRARRESGNELRAVDGVHRRCVAGHGPALVLLQPPHEVPPQIEIRCAHTRQGRDLATCLLIAVLAYIVLAQLSE